MKFCSGGMLAATRMKMKIMHCARNLQVSQFLVALNKKRYMVRSMYNNKLRFMENANK